MFEHIQRNGFILNFSLHITSKIKSNILQYEVFFHVFLLIELMHIKSLTIVKLFPTIIIILLQNSKNQLNLVSYTFHRCVLLEKNNINIKILWKVWGNCILKYLWKNLQSILYVQDDVIPKESGRTRKEISYWKSALFKKIRMHLYWKLGCVTKITIWNFYSSSSRFFGHAMWFKKMSNGSMGLLLSLYHLKTCFLNHTYQYLYYCLR